MLSKLLPGVLATLVSASTSNAAAEGDDHRADEQLKRLKSLAIVSQKVNAGTLGVLVAYLADVLVAAYGYRRKGPYQVPVA